MEPGQTTAIVGSTGTGKSTLINLIPRSYDVTTGQVEVDGVDVRTVRRRTSGGGSASSPSARSCSAGRLPQPRFGAPDATDDDLWRALEVAQAREFVAAIPTG